MATIPAKGPSPLYIKRRRALVSSRTTSLAPMLLLCAFFVVVTVLFPFSVEATVFLPAYNRSFVSLPGRFGGQLSDDPNDLPVVAYLTLVPDQPYMCPDELKRIQPVPPVLFVPDSNSTTNGNRKPSHNDSLIHSNMMVSSNELNDTYNSTIYPGKKIGDNQLDPNVFLNVDGIDTDNVQILPPPSNDLPVALLVERGLCTFFEKAAMASRYGPAVKYLIIYDNQVAPDLVLMSSDYETDMTILFVSATTGHELVDHIIHSDAKKESKSQANENETENENENIDDKNYLGYNLIVQIDGISPPFSQPYRGLNMAAYFLAAMSGFLAFLIFFGCLLICAQCGCITAAPDENGRIVLFAGGPGIRHTEGLARMIRVDKLTRDQVMLLDVEEFETPSVKDEENPGECCSICLDEFEEKENLRVLPCGHKFREDCLIPWLTQRHASCPLCKMDVLKYVREIEAEKNKKPLGKEESLDAPDGPSDDSASTVTQASSSPQTFWYRLRGWSLVAGSSDSEGQDNGNRNDSITGREGSDNIGSPVVSEIEMEMVTAIAAIRGDDTPMDS